MSPASRPDPQRVAALFAEIADLDPAAAESRLTAGCHEDAALRDAVLRVLAHDRAAAPGFLAPRPAQVAEALRRWDQAGPDGAGAGQEPIAGSSRLGRYYVLHKLAEGGMGLVYVGYDDALHRRVALKVLRRGAPVRQWLLREGQALGRLSHPNVVAVHEVGEESPGGRVFLAMELIEGLTLRAWLDERPRPFADTLPLFLQAGRGLLAAHRAGLVHRDFKPDNVLIGQDGRARVADFGIVTLAQAPPEETLAGPSLDSSALASPLTQTGVLMGTPAFMSPEQFRGERATPLSDQFSFCVALYRAAYGTSPYPDDEIGRLADSLRRDPPAPPPRLPAVPAWLAPILLRGLERDPARRFPSMDELLREIERHLPRDPELDATPILRERRILSGVIIASFIFCAAPMASEAGARALMSPAGLLAVPVALLLLFLSVIAWRWPGLSRNRYGRLLAGMPPIILVALLGHRLVALRLGLSGEQILIEDMVLFATVLGLVAHFYERFAMWLAACMAVPAAVAAIVPQRAPILVGVLGLLSAATMVIRLLTARHLNPAAIVRPYESEADAAGSPPVSADDR